MSFQIEVLKVAVENKGKYRVAIVDHKTSDGKVDSKKVMSFVAKDVFETLSKAQQGDSFEIVSEKDKNGYWQWISATALGKSAGGTSGAKSGPARSTYETSDERAARQVYIVRQSSIANAIAFQNGTERSVDDIIEVAKQFEAYVFSKDVIPEEVE